MNTSDFAVVAPWQTLLDKPSTFPPGEHTHDLSALERSGANFGDVPMFFEGKWIPVDITKQTDFVARLDETVEIIKSDTQTSVTAIRRLVADFGQANASITQTLKVLSDKNQALAESDEQLQVLFGRNQASVDRLASAVATANSSTANVITQLRAQLSADDIKIQALSTTSTKLSSTVRRVGNQVTASAQAITSLDSRITDAESGISGFATAIDDLNTEVTSINGQITALASRSTTLETQVNSPTVGILARISTIESVYVNSTTFTALATRTTTLETQVNTPLTGILARITTVETVKADASTVTAVASSVTTLTARLDTGDIASAINTLQVAVGPFGTLSTRIDALSASSGIHTFTGSSAPTATGTGDIWYQTGSGIVHEFRWDGSAWVSVKDTDIDINAAAIVTEASASLGRDGNLASKYTLSVIAGNVVTGMNLTSSTSGGTNISDVTFQATSFKIYNGTSGTAVFQVISGTVKIDGALLVNGSVTATAILAGNVTATHIASNEVITTSANIANAVITNAKIVDLDVSKLNAGTINVALELTAATFTAGSIATGATRHNSADLTRKMPFISYAYADLVTEFGAPITPADVAAAPTGTDFGSTNLAFPGWTAGSTGVDTKRFGLSTTAFFATLQGNGDMTTGRMGYDIVYKINSGSWTIFTGHNVVEGAFSNISMSNMLVLSGLAGSDTVYFGARIDHSSGAAGAGIGGLFLSVAAFNG